jgi:hypothetical protein
LLPLLQNQQNVCVMLAMPVTVVTSAILHLGFSSLEVNVCSALLFATQIVVLVYQTELAFVRTLQEAILSRVCSHAHFVIPTTMAILVLHVLAKALQLVHVVVHRVVLVNCKFVYMPCHALLVVQVKVAY